MITIWRNLAEYIPDSRRRTLAIAVASCLGGLAEAGALVVVVKVAVDVAGSGRATLTLSRIDLTLSGGELLAFAAVLAIVGALLSVALARLIARGSALALESARRSVLDAFFGSSWELQSQEREGALLETASTLSLQTSNLYLSLTSGCSAALNLAVLLLVAGIIDIVSMAAVTAAGLAIFLALRPLARITRRRAREFVQRNLGLGEQISRMSSLAMEVEVFGVGDIAGQGIDNLNKETARAQYRSRMVSRLGAAIYRSVAVLVMIGAVAVLNHAGSTAVADTGAVVILMVRSLSSAQAIQAALQSANEQAPNLETLRARIEHMRSSPKSGGSVRLPAIKTVNLVAVGYRYPDGAGWALQDVDLELRRGDCIGIVGPSGGGKSTLMQLLLGLRDSTSGKVLVNGVDLRSVDRRDWARLVAVVPQEPRLMEATIAENISFFRSWLSRDEVEAAAREANIFETVAAMEHGFDTKLGPRGSGLSGGQKQRVAIARALASRPDLLVLDEPTSALDVESERLFRATIESLKGETTLVIVAHRLSTISLCDRVILLKSGHASLLDLPASGSWEDVVGDLLTSAAADEVPERVAPE